MAAERDLAGQMLYSGCIRRWMARSRQRSSATPSRARTPGPRTAGLVVALHPREAGLLLQMGVSVPRGLPSVKPSGQFGGY